MLNKILDPLKLFVIGAIVAALIVLGFQLGKETDKGLLNYLEKENAQLEAELEKLRSENSALQGEKVSALQEALQTAQTEDETPAPDASSTTAPPSPTTAAPAEPVPEPAPAVSQIVDTFSPAGEESQAAEPVAESEK